MHLGAIHPLPAELTAGRAIFTHDLDLWPSRMRAAVESALQQYGYQTPDADGPDITQMPGPSIRIKGISMSDRPAARLKPQPPPRFVGAA